MTPVPENPRIVLVRLKSGAMAAKTNISGLKLQVVDSLHGDDGYYEAIRGVPYGVEINGQMADSIRQ